MSTRKVWHMRITRYARAFVTAPGVLAALPLYLRGWRPFESAYVSRGRWWSKPSTNQRALERAALFQGPSQ